MEINYEKLKDAYDTAAVSYYENKYVVGGWGINPWGDDESAACEIWKSNKVDGRIVSLGCGSGQDIRILDFPDKDKFVGYDISEKMLSNAAKKHSGYTYKIQDCSVGFKENCDVLFSVFGTPNYIGTEKLIEHYKSFKASSAFFVFYAEWYNDGFDTDYYQYTVEDLSNIFKDYDPEIIPIRNNYICVRW
jgi:SAM-dependent methyltransferase